MDHDAGHARSDAGPGYETSDANTRGIIVFGVWLFGFLVVLHLALFGLYDLFVRRRPPPISASSSENLYEQLRSLRQSEEETLSSYGWLDRKAGIARIPIDRAMDLVAERGVPRGKGPRTEAEVNSHHGTPVNADEKKAAPEEKSP
jgi:hypothetical protein